MAKENSILHNCLYFTANSLSRVITKMAEQEFMGTGLSPSHAFLIMLVDEQPGILQKELCEKLNLAPSTVTRVIDTLVYRGFLTRQVKGKSTMVFPTKEGEALQESIHKAWKNLHLRYAKVLGLKEGDDLTARVDKASIELGKTV
jgi:DNA-binding MarR family transcriptional regulator